MRCKTHEILRTLTGGLVFFDFDCVYLLNEMGYQKKTVITENNLKMLHEM